MFGKRKFYSLKEILKKGATYNIIMGERSNGKTYAALSYAIAQYFKTGKQAVLIRRWQTDIAGHRGSQMFAAFTSDFIKRYQAASLTLSGTTVGNSTSGITILIWTKSSTPTRG